MKIHLFPPSGRVVGIVALKNYLALDCELTSIDLGRGDQRDDSLKGKTWVLGNRLTLADFSIGGLLPTAERLELWLSKRAAR